MQESLRQSFPVITDDLLNALEKMYPISTPSPGNPLDSIMYKAGQRSVVEKLRELQDWQKNNRQLGVKR